MTTTRRYLVGVAVAWAVLGLVTGCGFAGPTRRTAPAPAAPLSSVLPGLLSNRLIR